MLNFCWFYGFLIFLVLAIYWYFRTKAEIKLLKCYKLYEEYRDVSEGLTDEEFEEHLSHFQKELREILK